MSTAVAPPPSAAPESSDVPVATASRFSAWLRTQGEIGVFPIHGGLAVIVHERRADYSREANYTVAPGYTLTEEGIHESPLLFMGLPRDDEARPSNIEGVRLKGAVGLSGDWPNTASLTMMLAKGGHAECMGCLGWLPEEYKWNGKRWTRQATSSPPDILEPRFNSDANPITFPNGTALWERFTNFTEYLDSPGESVFFVDGQHKKRALRQRAKGSAECHGGTRLVGPFKGVALSDGGLIGIGTDCQTGVISAEVWDRGATSSHIMELPGAPKGTIISHGALRFADSLKTLVYSSREVLIGFELSGGRAYIALFNGKTWTDLSPKVPTPGFLDLLRQPDSGLWLLTGEHWYRRSDNGANADDWVTACPTVQGPDGRAPSLVFDPQKRPWLYGRDSIVEYAEGRCFDHRLPTPGPNAKEFTCSVTNLEFLPNGEPVVARRCDSRSGSETTLLLERAMDRVVVR